MKQIALYDKKYQDYDLAILKSESRVRSIARQLAAREAGVSDTELEELTRSMVTLDESLFLGKGSRCPHRHEGYAEEGIGWLSCSAASSTECRNRFLAGEIASTATGVVIKGITIHFCRHQQRSPVG